QYTRNMVTAASAADAAVVLVDATKLSWRNAGLTLLPQTRRHSLLLKLLRVPSIVFAVNKLDAVEDGTLAFSHIRAALAAFASEAGIPVTATVPVSALKGWNVVDPATDAAWCGYTGPTLLDILECLPVTPPDTGLPLAFPVQWVEKFSSSSDTRQGRRVFWGRVATGSVRPGQPIKVMPGGQTAKVAQVLNHVRRPKDVPAGHSAGIVLDREVDVSRGDWLLAVDEQGQALEVSREIRATVAWLDDDTLVAGRVYWALHGHRWVKAKVKRIVHKLDIHTLAEEDANQLEPNAIGHIELALQEPLATAPFTQSRALGSLVLVDTASHRTSGAVLVS
ncbi:MAG: sulfate adenylyltransferase, partial [Hydrogenophaga sp.]|nr:sulfate adenylyltransferase [Hydrogenophaga sp.]